MLESTRKSHKISRGSKHAPPPMPDHGCAFEWIPSPPTPSPHAPSFNMNTSFPHEDSVINVQSFLRCTHHLRLKPGAKTVPDLVPLRRTHKRLSLQVRVGMNVVPHTKKLQAKHFSGKWSQFSVKISLCKGDGHMVPSGIFLPHTKKELPSSLSNCITTLEYMFDGKKSDTTASSDVQFDASLMSDHFGVNSTSADAYGTSRITDFSKPPHGLLFLKIVVLLKDTNVIAAQHWSPPLWVFTRVDRDGTPNHIYLSNITNRLSNLTNISMREEEISSSQMFRFSNKPRRVTVIFYENKCLEEYQELLEDTETQSADMPCGHQATLQRELGIEKDGTEEHMLLPGSRHLDIGEQLDIQHQYLATGLGHLPQHPFPTDEQQNILLQHQHAADDFQAAISNEPVPPVHLRTLTNQQHTVPQHCSSATNQVQKGQKNSPLVPQNPDTTCQQEEQAQPQRPIRYLVELEKLHHLARPYKQVGMQQYITRYFMQAKDDATSPKETKKSLKKKPKPPRKKNQPLHTISKQNAVRNGNTSDIKNAFVRPYMPTSTCLVNACDNEDDASTITKPLTTFDDVQPSLPQQNYNPDLSCLVDSEAAEEALQNPSMPHISYAPSDWSAYHKRQPYHETSYPGSVPKSSPKRQPKIRVITSISAEVDSE